MRIAQVTPVYPPYRGGIGKVAEDYTLELEKAGHKVQVFHPGNTKSLYKWGNAAFMPNLFAKLQGFDLIHLHYPFYGGAIFAALAASYFNIPLVITYHMKTQADGWLGLIFKLDRIFFEPVILLNAKNILISSLDYAKSIDFHHQNLVELPFWVDTEAFSPGKSPEIRKEFGISEASRVFIFVGGLDPAHYFKGVSVLLTAAAHLAVEDDWDIVIVGDGSRAHEFRQTVSKLGLEARVHFAGRVSEVDLPKYYKMADIHILPSINRSEAFGLVTLEAGASGLPSIVSDLPGVRTLVLAEETGYIVAPHNDVGLKQMMTKYIENPELAQRHGRNARERVLQKYSIATVFSKLQEIYIQSRLEKYEDRNSK